MREHKEMANLAVLADRGWGCMQPILTTEKNAIEFCVINFLWNRWTVYLRHIIKRILRDVKNFFTDVLKVYV
jgi:hypothetical protein